MAWFWNSAKKDKREIDRIYRKGNLPIYEIVFKGKGPAGGQEVRQVNMLTEKDPMIKKAINSWLDEEYMRVMEFSLDRATKTFTRARNNAIAKGEKIYKVPKKGYLVFNKQKCTYETVDVDTFLKIVNKL